MRLDEVRVAAEIGKQESARDRVRLRSRHWRPMLLHDFAPGRDRSAPWWSRDACARRSQAPMAARPSGSKRGAHVHSRHVRVPLLRCGTTAQGEVLPGVRHQGPSPGSRDRATEGRDGPVQRRGRIDGDGRALRSGSRSRRDGPLLRGHESGHRTARRHRREVHRRRGHGGVRDPAAARGRCAACRASSGRDADRARRPRTES